MQHHSFRTKNLSNSISGNCLVYFYNSIKDRIIDPNKSIPYYPLPTNEGYEKFLQKMKKDQCNNNTYREN